MICLIETGYSSTGRIVTHNETRWETRDEAAAHIKETLIDFAKEDGARRWASPYFPVRLVFDVALDIRGQVEKL